MEYSKALGLVEERPPEVYTLSSHCGSHYVSYSAGDICSPLLYSLTPGLMRGAFHGARGRQDAKDSPLGAKSCSAAWLAGCGYGLADPLRRATAATGAAQTTVRRGKINQKPDIGLCKPIATSVSHLSTRHRNLPEGHYVAEAAWCQALALVLVGYGGGM